MTLRLTPADAEVLASALEVLQPDNEPASERRIALLAKLHKPFEEVFFTGLDVDCEVAADRRRMVQAIDAAINGKEAEGREVCLQELINQIVRLKLAAKGDGLPDAGSYTE